MGDKTINGNKAVNMKPEASSFHISMLTEHCSVKETFGWAKV